MADYSPFEEVIKGYDSGVATAGNSDSFVIGAAPSDGKIVGVEFVPEAASTGDNTNKRTYTLVNKGQAGSGTTVIATLDLVTGTDLVAFHPSTATLTATAADRLVAEGDILAWVSTKGGTGLVDPGGTVNVMFSREQA